MSVVGFDLGNANCYVAVARAGGIETVDNDYSDRCTPAFVAFTDKVRMTGVQAKNQFAMNLKNTVSQVKRLLGVRAGDPLLHTEADLATFKVSTDESTSSVLVEVNYLGQVIKLSPEQLTAMILQELKTTAARHLSAVTDCVISVPSYFTDYQRRALLTASRIAGLNCLRLMNDTSAIALGYGLFKQDLPSPEEPARNVAFIDMGHSALQVCICSFNKGKCKVRSVAFDPCLGGRNFDYRLREHFGAELSSKYKINCRANERAWTRLAVEVEKIKKQMSSNSADIMLHIECFMDDKDVSAKINRAQFEELCGDLLTRVDPVLRRALINSGLTNDDIHVIEIVGGSTRMPAVKSAIQKVFGKDVSTTLNADEAVARGCAIQCAIMSHTVRVREIEVQDVAPYPVFISWESAKTEEPGEMELFPLHHIYPATKMLTLHRKEPFILRAYYHSSTCLALADRRIGEFLVKGVTSTGVGDPSKVKVKLRLNASGCLAIHSASMIEKLPTPPASPTKADPIEATPASEVEHSKAKPEEGVAGGQSMDTSEKSSEQPIGCSASLKKVKKNTRAVDLEVATIQDTWTDQQVNSMIELENGFLVQIKLVADIANARNSLEEYIYAMRDKLCGLYVDFMQDSDREGYLSLLNETEEWLYENGDSLAKQAFIDKLSELKRIGNPVEDRFTNHHELPIAFEEFGASMIHYKKVLDMYANKHDMYEHIEQVDMDKVVNKVDEKFKWLNEKMNAYSKLKKFESPNISPSQVQTERKLMEAFCNPIINKPKPKPESPKAPSKNEAPAREEASHSQGNAFTNDVPSEPAPKTFQASSTVPNKDNLDMDVD